MPSPAVHDRNDDVHDWNDDVHVVNLPATSIQTFR